MKITNKYFGDNKYALDKYSRRENVIRHKEMSQETSLSVTVCYARVSIISIYFSRKNFNSTPGDMDAL